MKRFKKLFISGLFLLVAVLLVACKKTPEEDALPVINGATNKTIEVGTAFDPKEGVTATFEGVDLTADIVITGTVDVNEVGTYTLTYKVKNAAGAEATVNRVITVIPTRLYAEGNYNFRFADPALRNTFFAAAEGYLLDNVYGGVPLFVNSGMSIYSDRVQLKTEEYVPVMGYGSAYGTLTAGDETVTFSGGKSPVAGKHTFRGAFSSNPTTLNQWLSDDSVSSDAAAYMLDSLYKFVFNEANTGYVLAPSLAADLPEPLNAETLDSGLEVATEWSVPVREGLKWGFHPNTVTTGLSTDITAKDFVDTFKFALENNWFRAIAGGSHFWSTSTPVVGAQAFANGEGDWDDVGIKLSDDGKSIEFTFTQQLSEWNLIYWLSSNTMSPVHLGLLEKVGINNYASTPQNMAFTGPYILETFEEDKVLEYVKNPNYHNPTLYTYDGFYFVIIERSEIIFAEFEAGNLDVAGVPLTKYEQYKDNDGVKRSPGATTFRMTINGLGTQEAQDAQFPNGTWKPEPILGHKRFKQALYYAVDRETLAWDVLKTSDPGMFYFSDAYLVDPQTGVAFRHTDEGQALGQKFGADSYGFDSQLAFDLYKEAITDLIADGTYKKGTAASPTVIELEVSFQAGSTSQAQLGEFIKTTIESTFVDTENHVRFSVVLLPVAFPDNYYAKSIIGQFDLAMGGISGSTLDAASFLEVFSSDNRGGFTLDWGFDTSIAEIPVTYTLDGKEIVNEYWSFDAIVSALNGPIALEKGEEVLDVAKINATIALINALPTVENYTLSDEHTKAFKDAVDAYDGLLPKAQAQVTNASHLFAINNKNTQLTRQEAADEITAILEDLKAADLTLADVEDVLDLLDDHVFNSSRGLNQHVALLTAGTRTALNATVAKTIELLVAEFPALANIEFAHVGQVDQATALFSDLTKLAGTEAAPGLVSNNAALVAAGSKVAVLKVVNQIAQLVLDEEGEPVLPEDVVLTDRYEIQDARAAFNRLSEDQQADVTNVQRLTDLEAAVKPLVDLEEAFLWQLALATLPNANDIRTTHRVQLETVIKGYNALSNEAKLLVNTTEGIDIPAKLPVLEDLVDAIGIADLVEIVKPNTGA